MQTRGCLYRIGGVFNKVGYRDDKSAPYPKITTASVNRLAVSEKASDLKEYLKMLRNVRPLILVPSHPQSLQPSLAQGL